MMFHVFHLAMILFSLTAVCLSPTMLVGQEEDTNPILDLTFDDIKFEMDKEEEYHPDLLTDRINELDGKKIRIRGYILPSNEMTLTKFVLVRDNQECCFGPGAALCDCVLVKLKKGETTEFTVRPITVRGTFYVKRFPRTGKVLAVFRMKDCVVE